MKVIVTEKPSVTMTTKEQNNLLDSQYELIEKLISEQDEDVYDIPDEAYSVFSTGNMLRQLKFSPLSKEEEKKLFADYHEGKIDKSVIFEQYARLIYKIAIKLCKNYTYLSVDDLFQDGCIGCLIAIDKYDLDKDTRFSTYATYWITQAIMRKRHEYIYVGHIPAHMYEKLGEFRKYLKESGKYNISDSEKYSLMKSWCKEKKYTLSSIQSAESMKYLMSLNDNATSGEGEERERMDTMVAPNNTEQEAIENIETEEVISLIDEVLSEKEKDVLKLRLGFGGNSPHTLEEIGKEYNVSRERIRQIEGKALRKLRFAIKRNKLKKQRKYIPEAKHK